MVLTMKKNFSSFPYSKKPPVILYDGMYLFHSKIFLSLYNKISGRNSWKMELRRNKFISWIVEPFTYVTEQVPSEDVNLVYKGYDRTLYFCIDKNLVVSSMFSGSNGEFVNEEYLGSTPNIFCHNDLKSILHQLTAFFRERWIKLKSGEATIHGDLTPFNICIEGDRVSLIDPKENSSDSIIFDWIYFYAYSISKIKHRKLLKSKDKNEIIQLINLLVKSSFPVEDLDYVIKLVSELKLNDHPSVENFGEFRIKFIELLESEKSKNHN